MATSLIFTLVGRDKLGPVFASAGMRATAFGGKLASAGKMAAIGLAAVTAGAAVATVGLSKIEKTWGDATDAIIVGTGAQGKALQSLIKDFDAVAKTTPVDLQSVGDAIADLNTRTGQSGPPLQDLARKMLNLSRLTKTDLKTNIASITRLFGDWSIKTKDQAGTLDKLFVASQTTGIGIDRLSELMVQFGSPLRQLGLGFDFVSAMFSRFEKEGVNIETAMPGLRMALKNFAAAGREPAPALLETMKAIRDASSTAKANTLAFQVFGVRAGPDLAAAIREGRFDLDALIKTLDSSGGALDRATQDTHGFTESWRMFKNQVLIVVGPLATKMFDALSAQLDKIAPVIDRMFRDLIAKAAPIAGQLATKAREWGGAVSGWAKDVDLSGVTRKITTTATSWGATFATQAAGWGKSIISGIKTGLDTGDWSGLGETVGNGLVKAIESAGKLAVRIGQVIGDLIGKVDWFQMGRAVGLQAPSFIIGFLDSLFDGIIKVARAHPFAFILTLVSIIFAPAKFLKPLVTVLRRIPIVGTIAAWLLTSLNKLGGPILKGLGFIGRAFLNGFRTVFPGVGESFSKWLLLLPTRLGVVAINLVQGAGRMMLGLAKAIGRGILWVVAQIGKLIALMLKPFVMAGSWLVRRGIELVTGLLRGILTVARTVGGWILRNVIEPLVRPFFLAGRWLVIHGRNFVAGLKNGVVAVARTIGRWVYSNVIVPTVRPFLVAGTWLVQHGKNLVAGLKNGIVATMKGIGGWVKAQVVDPIVRAVKSFFGIKSPSTVFAGIGSNLIAGLFKGLGSGAGAAIAKKVFGDMPTALGHIVQKGLVSIGSLPGKALEALGGLGGKFAGLFAASSASGGAGVQRWRDVAIRALIAAGAPVSWIGSLMRRMNQESGGNPNAINLWDSNAKAGHPSQGLMQTIPGTFNAYAGQFRSRGITDPFANIYAAIRYTIARYGSGPAGWDRPGGYRDGGWLMPGMLGFNETSKPEAVFTQAQLRDLTGGQIDYHKLADILIEAARAARPIEVEQNFPEKADPSAAVDAMAERLAGILGG